MVVSLVKNGQSLYLKVTNTDARFFNLEDGIKYLVKLKRKNDNEFIDLESCGIRLNGKRSAYLLVPKYKVDFFQLSSKDFIEVIDFKAREGD